MYTPRFRHRNVPTVPLGTAVFENYVNQGTCTAPNLRWAVYGSETSAAPYGYLDHIDDIAGDPPLKKAGKAGFRFHPMTRVTVEYEGSGDTSWLARNKTINCSGQAGQSQILYRRTGSYNASRVWSGLALPIVQNRLDLAQTPYPNDIVAQLRDLVRTEVLAKRGKYGESNLYESLFEANKTLGMLNDILRVAHRAQKNIFFTKGSAEKLKGLSNEAAGQYLATRYGFKPLLSDIAGILNGLDSSLGRQIRTTRSSKTWTSQQTANLTDWVDADTIAFTRQKTTTQSLVVRSMSLDDVEITLLGALGLGAKDFMSVPWELVTGSFIVDWFANVGDVISSLLPDIGLSNIGACTTIDWSCIETVSYAVKGVRAGKENIIEILNGTAPTPVSRKIRFKRRDVDLMLPQLRFKSDFRFDNLTRCLDALALLKVQTSQVKNQFPWATPGRPRRRSRKGVYGAESFLN